MKKILSVLPAVAVVAIATTMFAEPSQTLSASQASTLAPSAAPIQIDLQERDSLLHSRMILDFQPDASSTLPAPSPLTIHFADHPSFISSHIQGTTVGYTLNEKEIAISLDNIIGDSIHRSSNGLAVSTKDSSHVSIVRSPQDGFAVDTIAMAHAITNAMKSHRNNVTIPLHQESGKLFVQTTLGILQMSLLSHGSSNFANSPAGRAANVRKALDQYVNGYSVDSGKQISFNAALANSDSWYNSLIIVNGHDLVEAPGGGICQAATTAFRAEVLAGLPIIRRANHSLYVSYYKAGGVGIDATVLAGKQDLVALNDTGHPVVFLAGANGNDATVDMYGIPDGRSVTLRGPYFSKTEPPDVTFNGTTLRMNQIGWKQKISYPDAHSNQNDIVSTYEALPRTLSAEYAEATTTNN